MDKLHTNIQRFVNFINERHAVYLRREAGQPWPWTDDKILQTYKFTNVLRELDRGTIWCKEHIRDPYANDHYLFVNIAMYRRYNWIPTAQALGYLREYDTEAILTKMMTRRANGEQIFTGAHMLCGNIRDANGNLPPTKVEQIFGIAFPLLWEKWQSMLPTYPGMGTPSTLQAAFNKFMAAKIPGYGPFIIYEVISDLRWTKYLKNASDINDWANPGPGAKRGIMRLYGYSPKDANKPALPNVYCVHVMKYLLDIMGMYAVDYTPIMEMRDIEHSLCEWDKYERVRLGEGKPRAKFVPPHLRQV